MDWTDADRISDKIVNLVNREAEANTEGYQVLAGLMMGFLAFTKTLPQPMPTQLREVCQGMIESLEHIRVTAEILEIEETVKRGGNN